MSYILNELEIISISYTLIRVSVRNLEKNLRQFPLSLIIFNILQAYLNKAVSKQSKTRETWRIQKDKYWKTQEKVSVIADVKLMTWKI